MPSSRASLPPRVFAALVALTFSLAAFMPSSTAMAAWQVVDSLEIPGFTPDGAVLSPDGSTYYVVGSDELKTIDVATQTVTGTRTGPTSGFAVDISPDGSQLWVARLYFGTSRVDVLDATDPTLPRLQEIVVPNRPYDIALNADGSLAAVPNFAGNSVTVIDTATFTKFSAVSVGTGPISLDFNGDTLYVQSTADDSVSVVDVSDTANITVSETITGVSDPQRVAVSPDGSELWVTSLQGTITVIDTATNTIDRTITSVPQSDGIAFRSTSPEVVVTSNSSFRDALYFMEQASGDVATTVAPEVGSTGGLAVSSVDDSVVFYERDVFGVSSVFFVEDVEQRQEVVIPEPAPSARAAEAALHLDATATMGRAVAEARVLAEGQGLARGEAFSLALAPGGQVLASGTASRLGYFSTDTSLPAGLTPGTYTLTLTTKDPAGNPLVLTERFGIDAFGLFTAPSPTTASNAGTGTTNADATPAGESSGEATEAPTTSADPDTSDATEASTTTQGSDDNTTPAGNSNTDSSTTSSPEGSSDPIPGWLVITASSILITLVLGGVGIGIYRARQSRAW